MAYIVYISMPIIHLPYFLTPSADIFQRFSRVGPRGRARELATIWVLTNNRLEEVCGTLTKGTFSSRLLLSNQDKGCTPSVAHSLPLPPGFCSTFHSCYFTSPKLSMFCAPSQNYPHFFGSRIMSAPRSQLSEKLKSGITILSAQTVVELLIKRCKMLFSWITQEPLGPIKFQCHFQVFFQKVRFLC